MLRITPFLLAAKILVALPFSTVAQTWEHQGKPAQVIELFTSEGCSSCPPADQYLSEFQDKPTLWQEYIPVAYHVDYWNYLGWEDKFASAAFSQKQRLYKAYGVTSGVYTPGFIVDGNEWRGYFNWLERSLPESATKERSLLALEKLGDEYYIRYENKGEYIAHITLLAMDEITEVKAGENKGKLLEHDFVVLYEGNMKASSDWHFTIPERLLIAKADAVAVWLTKPGSFKPEQTVAGWIKP